MLEHLLKKQPEYYEASLLLGDILCEQEKYKEALNVYSNALKYRPNDYELYYNLGIAYTSLNDFQNAKSSYEKAAQINAILYKAHYNLGQVALIFNELEEAEKYFLESIKGEEVEAMSYYQLARIYMLKGENDKAINYINLAIELDFSIKELFDNDPIFIPIRVYMTITQDIGEVENKKSLSVKEKKNNEHLDRTYYLVGKLGYDVKRNVKQVEIERDAGREREIEE